MSAVAMSNFKFDVVEYIKKLRNVGVTQEIAEVQAQELEQLASGLIQRFFKLVICFWHQKSSCRF